MTQSEFQQLLQKYLKGNCTEEESALINQWYERLDSEQPTALAKEEQFFLKSKLWNEITQETAPPEQEIAVHPVQAPAKVVPMWRVSLLRAGVAAAVFLTIGLTYFWSADYTQAPVSLAPKAAKAISVSEWIDYKNTQGQISRIQLADGSKVFLYPNSSLRYKRQFTGPQREVYLSGEAFFKVQRNPNRPFLVFADKTVTTVLGTSFTIKAYPDKDVVVAVKTGRVSVSVPASTTHTKQPKSENLVLLPLQQAIYLRVANQLKKEVLELPKITFAQQLFFEEKPVAEVLTSLASNHGVEMIYDEAQIKNCTVSVTFYNESLQDKLNLLCKVMNASFEIVDKQVVIFSKGCNEQTE